MSPSFCQGYFHIVFSTADRQKLLKDDLREGLFQALRVEGKRRKSPVVRVNAMPDHVHMLVQIARDISVSDFVKHIKLTSGAFLKSRCAVNAYGSVWQNGYGAFSVSESQRAKVARYIDNQQHHHAKKTFKEEFIELLKVPQIEYDPKYL